jgi:hypothetical protein
MFASSSNNSSGSSLLNSGLDKKFVISLPKSGNGGVDDNSTDVLRGTGEIISSYELPFAAKETVAAASAMLMHPVDARRRAFFTTFVAVVPIFFLSG